MFNRSKAREKYEEAIQTYSAVTERIAEINDKISKVPHLVRARRYNDIRQLMSHTNQ